MTKQEVEAKFLMPHLADVREHLLRLNAHLLVSRTLERNWRFDSPDGRLSAAKEVLRLRQDTRYRLTFKQTLHSPEHRLEVEFEVGDLDGARRLLEALGYEVTFIYEKYRETFALGTTKVMLDELPFGCFVELEGTSLEDNRAAAQKLGLDWEHRIQRSYLELFTRLKKDLGLTIRDATFDDFSGQAPVDLTALGFSYASAPPGKGGGQR